MPISTIGQNGLNAPLSLTSPALGTPSALVLTNATGLPQTGLATGVAGTGPAFSAYSNSAQTVSAATLTKIQFNTETFDTANCYDTTNYRFTPNVTGYYQVNTSISFGTARTFYIVSIYKTGGRGLGGESLFTGALSANSSVNCQNIVYMNGSTDYLEIYVYCDSGTNAITTGINNTYFSSALVRGA